MGRMTHRFRGTALVVVAFSMVSITSVRAQNTAPLARGEVLLQLQQNATLTEPIGSISVTCTLSANGDTEAAALAALTKKRNELTQQLSKVGAPTNAIVETGKPAVTEDYEDYSDAAQAAVDAAANAVDATGGDDDTYIPSSTAITKKASQSLSFRFTSYAQFEGATIGEKPLSCGGYDGSMGRANPMVVGPVDPEGASRRAQQQAVAEARKRADIYASSMGMKVLRIQRVSEVGELDKFFGPELPKDFFRMAMNGMRGQDSNFRQNKVQVTEGLFVDFVLGPK